MPLSAAHFAPTVMAAASVLTAAQGSVILPGQFTGTQLLVGSQLEGDHTDGVAVGVGVCDRLMAQDAAAASLVIDSQGDAQVLAHSLAECAQAGVRNIIECDYFWFLNQNYNRFVMMNHARPPYNYLYLIRLLPKHLLNLNFRANRQGNFATCTKGFQLLIKS